MHISPAEKKHLATGLRFMLMASLTLFVAGSVFASWQDNASSPTVSNASAPINVGDAAQTKGTVGQSTGSLTLNAGLLTNGLRSYLPAIFDQTVQIKGGTPNAGEVLTATDSAGDSTWSPSTSGNLTYYWEGTNANGAYAPSGVNSDGSAPIQLTYSNNNEVAIPDNANGSKHTFCALAASQDGKGNIDSGGSYYHTCRVYTTGGGNFKMLFYSAGANTAGTCAAVCF